MNLIADNPVSVGGIVVLGGPGAGASFVARVLVRLGFEVPGSLPEPTGALDDDTGAVSEIADVNEALLASLGSSRNAPWGLDPKVLESGVPRPVRERLDEIVRREIRGRRRWVLADPRIGRLVPPWRQALAAANLPVVWLHVVRRPFHTPARGPEGHSRDRDLLPWLRHHLESEAATRDEPRAWIHLEDLRVPGPHPPRLQRVWESLGVPWPEVERALASVTPPAVVRQRPIGDPSPLHPWIDAVDRALNAGDGVDEGALDGVRETLATAERLLDRRAGGPRFVPAPSPPGSAPIDDEPADRCLGALARAAAAVRDVAAQSARAADRLAAAETRSEAAWAEARTLLKRRVAAVRRAEREAGRRRRREADLAAARHQIEQLRQELDRTRAELRQILERRSWRYTAPLRGIGGWWKTLKGSS